MTHTPEEYARGVNFERTSRRWSIMRILKTLAARTLRLWGRTAFANGYYYQAVESVGAYLDAGVSAAYLFNGCRVQCRLRELIQRQIYFFGAHEPVLAYLFDLAVEEAEVVVDAGANIGQYSLIAGRKGKQVYAFEPVPKNVIVLNDNVDQNGLQRYISVIDKGLWSDSEGITLYLDQRDALDNATDYTVGYREQHADAVAVATTTLDEFVEQRSIARVDLIKMDIEGAELFALRGMEKVLMRDHPTVFLEVNRPNCESAGYQPGEMWAHRAAGRSDPLMTSRCRT